MDTQERRATGTAVSVVSSSDNEIVFRNRVECEIEKAENVGWRVKSIAFHHDGYEPSTGWLLRTAYIVYEVEK